MAESPEPPETTVAAVDGTDALAYVIIRPGQTDGAVSIEAAATGISKETAAFILQNVVDRWNSEATSSD